MKPFRNLVLTGLTGLVSLLASAQNPNNQMSLQQTLRAHQWEKRILLLCTSASRQADYLQQKEILKKEEAGLKERDMLVLEINYKKASQSDKDYLEKELKVKPAPFAVVLLGKDGGVKIRQNQPLSIEGLFSTIDAMPMRKREMKDE
jgi:hypothetical protein